jgi:hypothetical protein
MSQSKKEIAAALLNAAPQRKSGRAVFDQGHTVWEWQTATGVFARDVSEEQMSRLEASDLCLVEQSPPAKDSGQAIYGSSPVSRQEAITRNRAPVPRANVGAFRQLWRRLVLAG